VDWGSVVASSGPVPHKKNPTRNIGPGWGCGQVFPNVSLAVCPPLKLALAPYMPDSGTGTGLGWDEGSTNLIIFTR